MGDPKKPRKKFSTPRYPWRAEDLSRELYLVGTYGLRNKRELWRTQSELSRIRKEARKLLAAPAEVRESMQRQLLLSLSRRGLVSGESTLDDVLGLTVEDILQRRLQSVVVRKGLAKTPYQARQIVVHGHVKVRDRIINIPGYMVYKDEEELVRLKEDSHLVGAPVSESPPSAQVSS